MTQMVFDSVQAGLSFVRAQTTHIEAGVAMQRYRELDYASMLTVDTSPADWAQSVTYMSGDAVGEARMMNLNSGDVPLVNFGMQQHTVPLSGGAIGYGFGLEEVNQAAMLGVSLGNEGAIAARRVGEEKIYKNATVGLPETGAKGLYNHDAVPQSVLATVGTGGSTKFSAKDPDQIIADVNGAISQVNKTTNQAYMPDTLRLPLEALQHMSVTRLTDTSTTILKFLQENNLYTLQTGQPLNIRADIGLDAAGAGGTGRMVVYSNQPEAVKMAMPMSFRFLSIYQLIMGYQIPGIFRIGPVNYRVPKSAVYVDGV